MAKQGWDGLDILGTNKPIEQKDEQFAIDKSFARTFETEEGKKCLQFLIKKTLEQPTWVPGGDSSFGYVREGQNSVIREIQQRIERAKS